MRQLARCGVYQCDFVRRGALDVDGDREPLTIGDGHDLASLGRIPG
jgi:hypothetical protein